VIDVEKDLVQVVEFPEFEDRDGKIEVVESLPVDTLERDGRRLKLRKRYRLAPSTRPLQPRHGAGALRRQEHPRHAFEPRLGLSRGDDVPDSTPRRSRSTT